MSDDDPVEAFVEGTVEPFDDGDEAYDGPKARDMEAELRERTGGADGEDVETEVGSETASAFWAAVIYVNAAVLLIALGPVVYALRGRPLVSVALVAAGVVAFWRAYGVYREFDADDGDDTDEVDEDADDSAGADDEADDSADEADGPVDIDAASGVDDARSRGDPADDPDEARDRD